MKNQIAKITSNPIGSVVGGVAFFYGAKKFGNISNMYALVGVSLLGVVVGAMAQAKFMPKGQPTAAIIVKK
jgi:hypothetical protein